MYMEQGETQAGLIYGELAPLNAYAVLSLLTPFTFSCFAMVSSS
jgi:hypothetical protein